MIGPPHLNAASLPAIDAGRRGRIAIAYMGHPTGSGWHGYMTISANALTRRPVFYTATVNPPNDPLVLGSCDPGRCAGAGDFFDVEIGSDGVPTAAFVDACMDCASGNSDNAGEGVVGRLVGGPPLR